MGFANQFDTIVVNDDLETAFADAEEKVRRFLAH